MDGRDVGGAVRRLLMAEPARCDRDALAVLVRLIAFVRAWLDALEARVGMRATELAAAGACERPEELLTNRGRRSAREGREAARRARLCEFLPAFGDALRSGRVSAGHLDVLAAATRGLDDHATAELIRLQDQLVACAARLPVDTFARECRDLARILSRDEGTSRLAAQRRQRSVRRWADRQSGMHHTLISLDSEADTKMWTAIDRAVGSSRAEKQDPELSWEQLQADTVVDLITGARAGARRTPEVSVLIDMKTLQHGLHDASVAETSDGIPMPPDTIRRLACDATIVPVVLGGDGEVLDVGHGQRLATRAQRRALRAMHATCAWPGCTVPFDACRIHHVTPWEQGGTTNLDNLLPLCESGHHHLVHEGDWRLELGPRRVIHICRPDGTPFFHGTTTDRQHPRHQAA